MIEKCGLKFGEWLCRRGAIEYDQIDDIRYAIEIICSEILGFTIIFFYGIYYSKFIETLIYMFVFSRMRKYFHGFHAKTIPRCLFLTVSSYLLTMYLYPYLNYTLMILLLIISIGLQLLYVYQDKHIKPLFISVVLHIGLWMLDMISGMQTFYMLIIVDLFVLLSTLPERRKHEG